MVVSKKSARKQRNVAHHRRMALEKEYYVEALKYNEIIKTLRDAQLLKTMLNDGSGYPKLMKEIDGIPHGLLNFSYKLFLEKDVLDVMVHICASVDESDLFLWRNVGALSY